MGYLPARAGRSRPQHWAQQSWACARAGRWRTPPHHPIFLLSLLVSLCTNVSGYPCSCAVLHAQRSIIVPPDVGYGDKGLQEIPPNGTFELRVEVLSVA